METVAIVGVGLIGGSFALALRRAGFAGRILGVSSARTLASAREAGIIDDGGALDAIVPRADLVYLSQPIGAILDALPAVDRMVRPGTLITDAGSTKLRIVKLALETVRRGLFLGGHPMAGKETRGIDAAEAGLFEGRPYFITPVRFEDLEAPPVIEFVDWIRRIGAAPQPVSAEDHDRAVAFTSHLPQLASTALACALARLGGAEAARRAAGPGLLDATRLAMSSYELWRDIIATNGPLIDQALAAYIEELAGFRRKLAAEGLGAEFDLAADLARRLR